MIGIMSAPPLPPLLASLPHRPRRFDKGAFLFHRGGQVSHLFAVLDGGVELVRQQQNGMGIVLQRAAAGSILAEASLYTARYHCDAMATETSLVAAFDRRAILERLQGDPEFGNAWARHLAGEVRYARARGELLSLRTVSARLDAWLALHDGELPPKGTWKCLAAEIGVSPEALYREITARAR